MSSQAHHQRQQLVLVRASSGASSKDIYHTDPECPRLSAAGNTLRKPLDVLHDDIRHCKYCSGEVEPNKPGKQTHLQALKDLRNDDERMNQFFGGD